MAKRKASEIEFDPTIDENQLDREWLRQPKLYFMWARRAANAKKDAEAAEQAVNLAYAEAETYIRRHPKNHGLGEKPTEPSIKAAVQKDADYRAAQTAYLNAVHRSDIYKAAVRALDHRKTALENLVELSVREYFSTPRATAEGHKVVEGSGGRRIHGVRKRNPDED